MSKFDKPGSITLQQAAPENYRETLSALLDDESDDLELRRLCKFLHENQSDTEHLADHELLKLWQRFNLAQASLHGELSSSASLTLSDTFAAGIMDRLAVETTAESSSSNEASATRLAEASPNANHATATSSTNWGISLSKLAIAASVAAVFVVVLQPSQFDTESNGQAIPSNLLSSDQNTLEVRASNPAPGSEPTQVAEIDPVAQQRLREYIDAMTFDNVESQTGFENFQESPLFRLVNEIQDNTPFFQATIPQ